MHPHHFVVQPFQTIFLPVCDLVLHTYLLHILDQGYIEHLHFLVEQILDRVQQPFLHLYLLIRRFRNDRQVQTWRQDAFVLLLF